MPNGRGTPLITEEESGLLSAMKKHLKDDVYLTFWDRMNEVFYVPSNPLHTILNAQYRVYLPHGSQTTRNDVMEVIKNNASLPIEEKFLPCGVWLPLQLTPREEFINDPQGKLRLAMMRYDRVPYGFDQQVLLAMTCGALSVSRANDGGVKVSNNVEDAKRIFRRSIASGYDVSVSSRKRLRELGLIE